ncbi:MAG: preprotein translocase subunit SecY [Candidatus Thermoplasmatota archaeon]|nr:preprotein translocase subunit SecY [Candidatus Thermoplasmatota archaeon]
MAYGEEKIPRNKKVAIPILIFWVLWAFVMNVWMGVTGVGLYLFILMTGPVMGVLYMALSYSGEGSKLFGLRPITDRLPAVKKPEIVHVHFRTKMYWTIAILVLYFIMTNVFIYGLDQESTIDLFAAYRAILAGAQGSLMHLGIGPIVTGSIIMQLFVGAKIINLDLAKEEDKATYQGVQKLIVIFMIFVEGIPQVYGYLVPAASFEMGMESLWAGNGALLAKIFIVLQLFIGSYLVFFMDELVSKWGIGSGISLFIAAGVSQAVFTGTLNWMPANSQIPLSLDNPPAGAIPKTFYVMTQSSAGALSSGGIERLILQPPNPLIALVGTIIIFLIVAYVESTRLEIPLAHESGRGARGRYPIRLIYASNIPVILMGALLANVSMFSLLLWSHPTMQNLPLVGGQWWIGAYAPGSNEPIAGMAWYLQAPRGLYDWLLPLLSERYQQMYMPHHDAGQLMVRLIVYVMVMIVGSIIFAKFWIETTNMGAKDVAKQIQGSGMRIPGFRREPKRMELVLGKYIPVVTVLSGAFVGALAAGADLIGTVGNTSGTGLLLAVGILIHLYEDMAKEEMMEMHPMLRGFFGNE